MFKSVAQEVFDKDLSMKAHDNYQKILNARWRSEGVIDQLMVLWHMFILHLDTPAVSAPLQLPLSMSIKVHNKSVIVWHRISYSVNKHLGSLHTHS